MNRRTFLKGGSLIMMTGADTLNLHGKESSRPLTKIGLVTDLHHADKDARGTRFYRESLGKLEEAHQAFAEESTDLAVELGDFIDSAQSLTEE